MKKDERVQVKLQSGTTHLTCWVDKKVCPGNFITLKDSEDTFRAWEVLSVGEPKKASKIKSHRDYRVGGLR